MQEEDDIIKENPIIFKKFKLKEKIGQGAFGSVYSGINILDNKYVAMKFEKRNIKTQILKDETYFLYLVRGFGIPEVLSFGKIKDYWVLVETLLGKNLFDIFLQKQNKFSLKEVCMIAIQILDRIQYVHSKFIIHRDIKPNNFVIGRDDPNVIYLVDFGLCKKYRSSKTKCHIKFANKKKIVGTLRFLSLNALKGGEQSRKDDLISIGYVLIFFIKGKLPWQSIKGRNMEERYTLLYKKRLEITPEKLCDSLPEEFAQYMKYVENLAFEEEPDYKYMRNLFISILSKNNLIYDKLLFSWINLSNYKNLKKPVNPVSRKVTSKERIMNKIKKNLKSGKSRANSSSSAQEISYQTLPQQYINPNMQTIRSNSKDILDNVQRCDSKIYNAKTALNTIVTHFDKSINTKIMNNIENIDKQMENQKSLSGLSGGEANKNIISPDYSKIKNRSKSITNKKKYTDPNNSLSKKKDHKLINKNKPEMQKLGNNNNININYFNEFNNFNKKEIFEETKIRESKNATIKNSPSHKKNKLIKNNKIKDNFQETKELNLILDIDCFKNDNKEKSNIHLIKQKNQNQLNNIINHIIRKNTNISNNVINTLNISHDRKKKQREYYQTNPKNENDDEIMNDIIDELKLKSNYLFENNEPIKEAKKLINKNNLNYDKMRIKIHEKKKSENITSIENNKNDFNSILYNNDINFINNFPKKINKSMDKEKYRKKLVNIYKNKFKTINNNEQLDNEPNIINNTEYKKRRQQTHFTKHNINRVSDTKHYNIANIKNQAFENDLNKEINYLIKDFDIYPNDINNNNIGFNNLSKKMHKDTFTSNKINNNIEDNKLQKRMKIRNHYLEKDKMNNLQFAQNSYKEINKDFNNNIRNKKNISIKNNKILNKDYNKKINKFQVKDHHNKNIDINKNNHADFDNNINMNKCLPPNNNEFPWMDF